MVDMRKRWLAIVLAAVLMLPAAPTLAADSAEIRVSFAPLHYVIDGVEYKPPEDQLGFIYLDQSRTYVPLRFVANILNKYVHWDAQTFTVTVSDPTAKDWTEIRKNLDEYRVDESVIEPAPAGSLEVETITVNPAEVTYVFNGQTVEADSGTPGFIYNDRIYVPLSFVYASLGFEPKWDGETYTITTETDAERLAYETAVKAADVQLRELENACKERLFRWYVPFNANAAKYTEEELASQLEQVETLFKGCEAEVRDLLDELAFELEAAGHSTAVVDEYWIIFDELEQLGRSFLSEYIDAQ